MTNTKTAVLVTLPIGLGVILLGILGSIYHSEIPIKASSVAVEPQKTEISIETLLDAIEAVESGGDPNAIGDGGRAVGAYQIWKIYVDDVNNINTFGPKYNYEDRWDRNKSRAMAKAYLYWYVRFTRGVYNKKPEWDNRKWEYMARIHNGGPNGWKKECTKSYWLKVKRAIEGEWQ
jgi:hypothetical protein